MSANCVHRSLDSRFRGSDAENDIQAPFRGFPHTTGSAGAPDYMNMLCRPFLLAPLNRIAITSGLWVELARAFVIE